MTQDDVIKMLYQKVRQAGSQIKFAEQLGITPAYLSDILHGRRELSDKVLAALNLKRVVSYEKVK